MVKPWQRAISWTFSNWMNELMEQFGIVHTQYWVRLLWRISQLTNMFCSRLAGLLYLGSSPLLLLLFFFASVVFDVGFYEDTGQVFSYRLFHEGLLCAIMAAQWNVSPPLWTLQSIGGFDLPFWPNHQLFSPRVVLFFHISSWPPQFPSTFIS